mmetsp:Transcript_39080/g.75793  ORF Transcript_39080/g.75793 Transcript_39080/m.75793 type:complete len:269 (+) Transcript_39080:307-1113(+)
MEWRRVLRRGEREEHRRPWVPACRGGPPPHFTLPHRRPSGTLRDGQEQRGVPDPHGRALPPRPSPLRRHRPCRRPPVRPSRATPLSRRPGHGGGGRRRRRDRVLRARVAERPRGALRRLLRPRSGTHGGTQKHGRGGREKRKRRRRRRGARAHPASHGLGATCEQRHAWIGGERGGRGPGRRREPRGRRPSSSSVRQRHPPCREGRLHRRARRVLPPGGGQRLRGELRRRGPLLLPRTGHRTRAHVPRHPPRGVRVGARRGDVRVGHR